MKTTIQRYGLYGSITLCVLFLVSWTLLKNLDYSTQEILGYASILISLSFVFFGIKHFRDQVNNGTLSIGKALIIGLAISFITAMVFGILDLVYIKYINPNFTEEYYARSIETIKDTLPAAEFEIKKAELESEKELFMNPIVSFILMSMTVLVIGFIISLISALILQRKQ